MGAKKRTKRTKETTAQVAARWQEVLAPMRKTQEAHDRQVIEGFLASPMEALQEIADLHCTLNPAWFHYYNHLARWAYEHGDMKTYKIAVTKFARDFHQKEVARGMLGRLLQAIRDVREGRREQEEAVSTLAKERTELMLTFFPTYIHSVLRAGEDDDEKAVQYLTAWVAAFGDVKRLKAALSRERDLETAHDHQWARAGEISDRAPGEEPMYAELKTAVAWLRQEGEAPLSAENTLILPERAIEDVRSFDPTRPEGGLLSLNEDVVIDQFQEDLFNKIFPDTFFQDWYDGMRLSAQQVVDTVERLSDDPMRENTKMKISDAEIAAEMGITAAQVRNIRSRHMLPAWDPSLSKRDCCKKPA